MYEYDFCEYAVEKKKQGAYLGKIVLAFILAVVVAAVIFAVVIPLAGMSIGMIAIIAVGALLWYLSRFCSIEYEYTQTGAALDFASVYSKQYRKEKLSVDLKKEARLVAPYKNGKIEGGHNPSKIYDFRSGNDVQNAYVIVFENEDGKNAVLFDATERMISNIRHQVPSITVLSDALPKE